MRLLRINMKQSLVSYYAIYNSRTAGTSLIISDLLHSSPPRTIYDLKNHWLVECHICTANQPIELKLNIVITNLFPCALVKLYLLIMSALGRKTKKVIW